MAAERRSPPARAVQVRGLAKSLSEALAKGQAARASVHKSCTGTRTIRFVQRISHARLSEASRRAASQGHPCFSERRNAATPESTHCVRNRRAPAFPSLVTPPPLRLQADLPQPSPGRAPRCRVALRTRHAGAAPPQETAASPGAAAAAPRAGAACRGSRRGSRRGSGREPSRRSRPVCLTPSTNLGLSAALSPLCLGDTAGMPVLGAPAETPPHHPVAFRKVQGTRFLNLLPGGFVYFNLLQNLFTLQKMYIFKMSCHSPPPSCS